MILSSVEFTLICELMMIELSIIRDCIAIFGVLAGFSYYVLTVRATRKNQEQQLETRRIQLFMQLANIFLDVQKGIDYIEVLNWTWDDYTDFERKYGSDNNPRAFAMRNTIWTSFNIMGKLVTEDEIDIDLVNTIMHDSIVWQWIKWKEIIYEQRRIYYISDYMMYWEQLADKLIKIRSERFPDYSVPVGLGTYFPDQ